MQLHEQVRKIHAFPGVTSHCGFSTISGRHGVFDSESSSVIFENRNQQVLNIHAEEDGILYANTLRKLLKYDIRAGNDPIQVLDFQSDILNIQTHGIHVSVSTDKQGIVTEDSRLLNLENPQKALCQCFSQGGNNLYAAYENGLVYSWNYSTEEYQDFSVPQQIKLRKLQPFGIYHFAGITSVGYEFGVSLYSDNGDFIGFESFGQRGRFSDITQALCFGDEYIALIVDNNTILPVDILKQEAHNSITIHGTELHSLTANYLFICAADDDEDGIITVLPAESFGDEFY